ncbi:ABC transporter transmembrane region [uncultured archaeon]|nr:ABC transporter transmembrane region [uncultured archaeon]
MVDDKNNVKDEPPIDYGFADLAKDIRIFLKPYYLKFFLSTLLRFSGEIVWLYPAWALGQMTDFLTGYSAGQPMTYFWQLMGVWAAVAVYYFISRELSKYYSLEIAERTALDARIMSMRHLFALDLAWHEKENSGNKMKRIDNGADGLNQIVRTYFENLIEASVSIVGVVLILFSLDWKLSVGLWVFILSYYSLSYLFTRRASAQARLVHQREEEVEGESFESLSNIQTIKAMGIGNSVSVRLSKSIEGLMAEIKKRIIYFRAREAFLNNYAIVVRLVAIAYIGYGIYQGRFEVGVLVMFYAYFDRIVRATMEMSTITNTLFIQTVAVGRMMDILKVEPTIEVSGKKPMKSDWKVIKVKNLSFSYKDRLVLKNVSFVIGRC